MNLAVKQIYQERKNVSKKEFEKAYVELADHVRLIDQKLATKADEVVLTMTLSHRQEIEELQSEIMKLREDVKKIKQNEVKQERTQTTNNIKTVNPFKNWFRKIQIARK